MLNSTGGRGDLPNVVTASVSTYQCPDIFPIFFWIPFSCEVGRIKDVFANGAAKMPPVVEPRKFGFIFWQNGKVLGPLTAVVYLVGKIGVDIGRKKIGHSLGL